MPPSVSILIVTYNSSRVLPACLDSVAAGTTPDFEIILVDNASQDGTPVLVRQRYPAVTLIENSRNCGFAAAVNQASRVAQGSRFLLLNPDTTVHPQAINRLALCLDTHPHAGLCAPRLLFPDGRLRTECCPFPSLRNVICGSLALGPLRPLRKLKRRLHWQPQAEVIQPVEVAIGAALFRQLRGLDERFFMYCEDWDFCLRAHQAGRSVLYMPQATVMHIGGHSVPSDEVRLLGMTGRYFLASQYEYFAKHTGKPAVWALRFIHALTASAFFLRGRLDRDPAKRKQHVELGRLFLLKPAPRHVPFADKEP